MPLTRASSRRTGFLRGGAVLVIGGVLLSGCAPAPEESSGTAPQHEDYRGCIVSDSGGFQDRSFNQNSYEGLQRAVEDYGIKDSTAESRAATDFQPNLVGMVQQNCNMIVTVGFNLSDATKDVAAKNPDIHFAIVDDNQIDAPNVKPIIYDTAQAAFQAGYLAAGASKTGKVATYGGMEIPTVTIFMDGFAQGVKYYNQQKGTDVRLLGWDKDRQTGTFTGDFEDSGKGKTTTQNFLNEGADVVMPVAGPVGEGTVDAVNGYNSGNPEHPARIVWVDSDGYETLNSGKEYLLTSVVKKMGDAVENTLKEDMDGKFTNKPYVGTLQNDGVGLTDFHDQAKNVTPEMKSELDQIREKIISGEITVDSPASPKSS